MIDGDALLDQGGSNGGRQALGQRGSQFTIPREFTTMKHECAESKKDRDLIMGSHSTAAPSIHIKLMESSTLPAIVKCLITICMYAIKS